MTIQTTIIITATGPGSKTALAECSQSIPELPDLLIDCISEWAEGFLGEHDDPDIVWTVNVKLGGDFVYTAQTVSPKSLPFPKL